VVLVEKEELMVVRVLMEIKMKREEGEKGFIFGIGVKGEEKELKEGFFCKRQRVRWTWPAM